MSQTQQQSICNRIRNRRISIFGHVGYVVCKDQYQRMKHFVWLSTPVAVTDLMSDWGGNVHEVVPVPDILGSASWRSMSGLLQMLHAWDMASDRDVWRAQRPVAGQAVQ